MSTLILVTSHGLRADQTNTFIQSLKNTAYMGDIGLISNDLKISGAIHHPWDDRSEYFRSSRRLFQYKEFLQKHTQRWDKVILTGIRDVLFQSNPELIRVNDLSLFQEHYDGIGPTIGGCPYNSKWISNSYGPEVLEKLYYKPIICAEIVVATLGKMHYFLDEMLKEAERNPRKHDLEDQAMLNKKYWLGELGATLYHNERSPVYTVGYMPYIRLGKNCAIYNESGDLPPVVHQYDRFLSLV